MDPSAAWAASVALFPSSVPWELGLSSYSELTAAVLRTATNLPYTFLPGVGWFLPFFEVSWMVRGGARVDVISVVLLCLGLSALPWWGSCRLRIL